MKMRFIDTLPKLFVGADPDTKNAAYAAVDLEGNIVAAFTVDSTSDPLAQVKSHDLYGNMAFKSGLPPFVAVVESQQIYRDDKKSNPDSMIKLARSSGISANFLANQHIGCSDLIFSLPREWKGSVSKHAHQAKILRDLGQEPVIKGKGNHRYCIPKHDFLGLSMTQYKHVIDSIGLALWLRDQYLWEFKKRGMR